MTTEGLTARIDEAARWVRERVQQPPGIALVLGSGLGASALGLEDPVTMGYGSIPHWPDVSVPGHGGELIVGRAGAGPVVAIASGRVHLYEGHPVETVTFGVRVLARLGCRVLVVTNASGSTRSDLAPGTLVLITDHIDLTGEDPTRGMEATALGARFLDMTDAYDPALRSLAARIAGEERIDLAEGVYSARKGPCYETPAEVRMARILGADLVGMSTVPEVIAARHCGMRVLGISCVTNLAAGIEGSKPDHEEVAEVAGAAAGRLAVLVRRLVAALEGETS